MKAITVLCVGKLKEPWLRQAAAEYQKRLAAFCRLEIVEVEEERLPDAPSPAQISHTLEAEGDRLLAKIPAGAAVFAMCIEGRELSSPALSDELERLAVNGTGHTVFIIGGSWGLADKVKQAARFRLSMSPMTFPHQLARVMLLEQLYRAGQIAAGGKYHK